MEEGTTIRKHGSILLESMLGENPSPRFDPLSFSRPIQRSCTDERKTP